MQSFRDNCNVMVISRTLMTFHAYSLLICSKEEKEKRNSLSITFHSFSLNVWRFVKKVTERVFLSVKMTMTVEGTYNYAPTFDHVDCRGDHVIVSIEM